MKTLKSDLFEVKIKSQGAELTSVCGYDHEYLWTSDPKFWNRHAPILFPIVGSLKDKKYSHQGINYQLNQHGFARDHDFTIVDEGENFATYSLKYTSDTLSYYPFKFELKITYKLIEDVLTVEYEVLNLDDVDMYYSIGGHPGFNIKDINDYELVIGGSYDIYTLDGAFIDQKITCQSGNKKCSPKLFENGAFIYVPNEKNDRTLTLTYKENPYIEVEYKDFPIMGVWTPEHGQAPFLCIEPWDGIADFKESVTSELKNKKHIQKLSAKDKKKYSYKIKFYEEK